MHSLERSGARRPHVLASCAAMLLVLNYIAMVEAATPANAGSQPSDAEIAAAVEKLKADPNLQLERKERTLRWKSGDDDPDAQQKSSGSAAHWIMEFLRWTVEAGRLLVWGGVAILACALVFYVLRFLRIPASGSPPAASMVPTHVRDLDIRPESLPDDIGAAALALWQQGEQRGALALLYRGLLSRLAHVHAVPIVDSSTEGDCLDLASRHLQAQRKDYVTQLIDTWQRAVYGAQSPDTSHVEALCAGFAEALAPAAHAGGAHA